MDEIRTERLLLRRARPDDLAGLHAVLSDARAMLYWSTEPHAALADTERWLEKMMAVPAGTSDDFVVEQDGRVIGKAGIWQLPEIGVILHPDVWRRGLAEEALRAAIGHAFARFPIPAITADVDPRNAASLALLDRLGFAVTSRAERTFRIGEAWCDSVYLALRRPEWRGERGGR